MLTRPGPDEVHLWVAEPGAGRDGFLQACLSLYLTEPPADWVIESSADGKPGLVSPSNRLQFNLSHCGDQLLLAVSGAGQAVGVDIESVRPRRFLRLAKRYFSETEYLSLSAMPPRAQPMGFYQIWTLKEAWLKGLGTGLRLPLNSFSFQVTAAGRLNLVAEPALSAFQGWSLQLETGHIVAVAAANLAQGAQLRLFRAESEAIEGPVCAHFLAASAGLLMPA